MKAKPKDYISGRGSQVRPKNKFESSYFERDVPCENKPKTQTFFESPKNIVSQNNSPDIAWKFSVNPYQGCEHGCTYCYARNSHQYWGFDAGLGFETKIVVKKNAPELLEKHFLKKSWKPSIIMLSGNTDCYQPLEKKFELTRKILEVCLKYRNPVGIITKNSLILRDLDLLTKLAKLRLVQVAISINSLDEELRRAMEPRTASSAKRLHTIRSLTQSGVPVMAMVAPIIPGLNHHESAKIVEKSAEAGALKASYTTVRLNGEIGGIFKNWLKQNYPDREDKVWNQIQSLHNGKVNDSSWTTRMRGDGNISLSIKQLFDTSVKKYMAGNVMPTIDTSIFRKGGNYTLF